MKSFTSKVPRYLAHMVLFLLIGGIGCTPGSASNQMNTGGSQGTNDPADGNATLTSSDSAKLRSSSPGSNLYPPVPMDKTFIQLGSFTAPKIDQWCAEAQSISLCSEKMLFFSTPFLGVDYQDDTNIGSPDRFSAKGKLIQKGTDEALTVQWAGMDCVTFLEYVLALCCAWNYNDFLQHLYQIKYDSKEISYLHRNHYMSLWVTSNEKKGYVKDITRECGIALVQEQRTLNVLSPLGSIPIELSYIPIPKVHLLDSFLKDGDIILFVSKKKNLDYQHIGMIVFKIDASGKSVPLVRHAQYKNAVIDDLPLSKYVKGKSYKGIKIIRPLCQQNSS